MIDVVRCKLDKECLGQGKELGFSDVLNLKVRVGGSDESNRKYVSDSSNDILMNPELKSVGDKVHYRRSGLNQVLAKLAKQNDVAIGFGFSFVLNAKGVDRGKVIGRMKQNVRICRKSKTKMIVCSYANSVKEMRGAKDLLAFARVIGMTPGEAKKALNWKRREKNVKVL